MDDQADTLIDSDSDNESTHGQTKAQRILNLNDLNHSIHVLLVNNFEEHLHKADIKQLHRHGFTVIVVSEGENMELQWLPKETIIYPVAEAEVD